MANIITLSSVNIYIYYSQITCSGNAACGAAQAETRRYCIRENGQKTVRDKKCSKKAREKYRIIDVHFHQKSKPSQLVD